MIYTHVFIVLLKNFELTILDFLWILKVYYSRHFQSFSFYCSLSELTECQIEIVQTPELIEQLAFSMLSPSYSIICPQTVISTFLCLSYSPQTHSYLTAPVITHTIFEVCKKIAQEWSSSNSRYALTQGSIIIVK